MEKLGNQMEKLEDALCCFDDLGVYFVIEDERPARVFGSGEKAAKNLLNQMFKYSVEETRKLHDKVNPIFHEDWIEVYFLKWYASKFILEHPQLTRTVLL